MRLIPRELGLRLPRLLQPAQYILRAQRQFIDARAGGVEDGVGDSGHGRNTGDFTGAFGAVWAGAGVAFNQCRFNARHHVDGRHQVIDE